MRITILRAVWCAAFGLALAAPLASAGAEGLSTSGAISPAAVQAAPSHLSASKRNDAWLNAARAEAAKREQAEKDAKDSWNRKRELHKRLLQVIRQQNERSSKITHHGGCVTC